MAPRRWPRLSDVVAGTLTGMGLAGVVGGIALAVILSGFHNAHPEPDPGTLAAQLLAIVALLGGLGALGGAYRGAMGGAVGCTSVPLAFLTVVVGTSMMAGQGLGLGWFFWLPLAIVVLVPLGAIVGFSAEAGVEWHRRARSPSLLLAFLSVAVPIVYVLAWTALYATQIARDRSLT